VGGIGRKKKGFRFLKRPTEDKENPQNISDQVPVERKMTASKKTEGRRRCRGEGFNQRKTGPRGRHTIIAKKGFALAERAENDSKKG